MSEKDLLTFKIFFLGENYASKNEIIYRYTDKYSSLGNAIGINYAFKNIILKNGKEISLKLMNTQGQNKNFLPILGNNVDAILFVFSYEDENSFNNIKEWLNVFNKRNNNSHITKYLVGNYHYSENEDIDDLIEDFIVEKGDMIYKSINSSIYDSRIDDLFQELGEIVYEKNNKKDSKLFNSLINSFKINRNQKIKRRLKQSVFPFFSKYCNY